MVHRLCFKGGRWGKQRPVPDFRRWFLDILRERLCGWGGGLIYGPFGRSEGYGECPGDLFTSVQSVFVRLDLLNIISMGHLCGCKVKWADTAHHTFSHALSLLQLSSARPVQLQRSKTHACMRRLQD